MKQYEGTKQILQQICRHFLEPSLAWTTMSMLHQNTLIGSPVEAKTHDTNILFWSELDAQQKKTELKHADSTN